MQRLLLLVLPLTCLLACSASAQLPEPGSTLNGTAIYSLESGQFIPALKGSLPIKAWSTGLPDTQIVLSADGIATAIDGDAVMGAGVSMTVRNVETGIGGGLAYMFRKGLGFSIVVNFVNLRFN